MSESRIGEARSGARRRLQGLPAAPGVARGRWTAAERRVLPAPRVIGRDRVNAEVERLGSAARSVALAATALAARVREAGHPEEAEIFSAHAAIAQDPDLLDGAARRTQDEAIDAIGAILAEARAVADQLAALDDDLLRARAADVLDVADGIARELAGYGPEDEGLREPGIVVAHDLPPSVTATLPRERLLGIALEGSSRTAHAAILARAYGIPSVVGVRDLLAILETAGPDAEIILDGSTGEMVVDPNAGDLDRFAQRAAAVRSERDRDETEATLPATTRDGAVITLLANLGGPAESGAAIGLGAQGVGLFRSEFLFLERAAPPSEDEQLRAYSAVVAAFAPRPVTIRLLDVGGDKDVRYLGLAAEANPFLGVRALRLAEGRPELFVTQLRACYRAAAEGRVKVMAPMIADATDVAVFLDLAARARSELVTEGRPIGQVELGVMLEIPSAILAADSYLGRLGFASVGTNDLLQYTLAADRGNERLDRYRDALHPALLRLVRMAVDASARGGIELSVCGEMAGEPLDALALVGLGVRSLSMAPSRIPAVRRAIRSVAVESAATAATAALSDASALEARARFAALVASSIP